ncbi:MULTISPECIES: hypothetical protein [unclassified Prochlorococcus]|uniref:hypothetical protein n=1 Tax=unclassified Prochlorococcus TaxID=2627481 RepID=UPI000533975C|nr:hypothetical protein EV12_2726 [Prochlorococcus sp. MIT 0701]KGG25998.1 hypothetical protein EV13_2774 [Prochlorococcus sp. MIT 0702]KGG30822.1 hypothetical protein EV14_2759 [Prochlorococcus sp. MIT 0703]
MSGSALSQALNLTQSSTPSSKQISLFGQNYFVCHDRAFDLILSSNFAFDGCPALEKSHCFFCVFIALPSKLRLVIRPSFNCSTSEQIEQADNSLVDFYIRINVGLVLDQSGALHVF